MAVSLARDLRFAISKYSILRYYDITLLRKEQIGDGDGGDDSGEVGQQAAGDGMAGMSDTDAAEVDGQDVERGVCATLEDTAQASDERVGTVGRHCVHHHAAGTTAGERFHQCRGQRAYPVGVKADGFSKTWYW